jgi:hypothetical protein
MNKKEAAVWLSVSEKTLERAVKDGKLSARMEKGKTRDILVFDDDELARFKEQREQPTHLPSVVKTEPPQPLQSLMIQNQTSLDNQDRQIETGSVAHLAEAMESLADAQKMTVLQNKPTLNLHEAALMSGLSVTSLEKAVKAGSLKTFTGLRGSKVIRRKDLDQFIDELS